MGKYKIVISTDKFKPFFATKKNWENGTINDFMYAINGWKVTELNFKNVKNRINLMLGYGVSVYCYENEYEKWLKKSYIKFMDRMCGFERTERVGVYGTAQGYVDVDKHLQELKDIGQTKIFFKDAYDIRQYPKNYDGCYIEIIKK